MKLGELIKSRRDASGLSLQELADACGVTKSHIWELEQGSTSNPSLRLTIKLSMVLGVSVGSLAATLVEDL